MTPSKQDLEAWRGDLITKVMAKRIEEEVRRRRRIVAMGAISGQSFVSPQAIEQARVAAAELRLAEHFHEILFSEGAEISYIDPEPEEADEVTQAIKSPFDFAVE